MGVSKDTRCLRETKPLFTEDTYQVNSPIQHLLIKAHTISLPVTNQETQGPLVWVQWPLVMYPQNMSSRTFLMLLF